MDAANRRLRELEAALEETRHAAEKAAADSRAKSDHLAHMSHEIRTPMNGIIGMIELLLNSPLNEKQRRYAEVIRASGMSLLALMNDVLDYSKIEAGKLELESVPFDLEDELDQLSETFANTAFQKNIELICAVDPGTPTQLVGDPARLRQILMNLVSNAIKFTEQGEVAVRARHTGLFPADDPAARAHIAFSVCDTGVGIPADKQAQLFEKYYQVKGSNVGGQVGTGLGLAICKELVELMGGSILVRSEAGQGSEFSFSVTLDYQEGQTFPNRPDLNQARVLVLDECAIWRTLLGAHVMACGARMTPTETGQAALDELLRGAAEGDPYDLAWVDMSMVDMDGETFGRLVREHRELDSTRLIMLSSLGLMGEERYLRTIGFSACIPKPIRIREFLDVASRVLTGESDQAWESAAADDDDTPRVRLEEDYYGQRDFRILIAEDNPFNQEVALGMLENLGLSADAVENGERALEILQDTHYDLILMDMEMPVMDGLETTRQIRAIEAAAERSRIPIVALTAHAMVGDRERFLRAGLDDFLAKPLRPDQLVTALDKWLPDEGAERVWNIFSARQQAPLQSGPEPDEMSVFDRAGMLARLMGDEELAERVLGTFLGDMPRQVQELRKLLDAGDCEQIRRAAHTMKGGAANIGAQLLHAVAMELELDARKSDLAAARSRFGDVEREFNRFKIESARLTLV